MTREIIFIDVETLTEEELQDMLEEKEEDEYAETTE